MLNNVKWYHCTKCNEDFKNIQECPNCHTTLSRVWRNISICNDTDDEINYAVDLMRNGDTGSKNRSRM